MAISKLTAALILTMLLLDCVTGDMMIYSPGYGTRVRRSSVPAGPGGRSVRSYHYPSMPMMHRGPLFRQQRQTTDPTTTEPGPTAKGPAPIIFSDAETAPTTDTSSTQTQSSDTTGSTGSSSTAK